MRIGMTCLMTRDAGICHLLCSRFRDTGTERQEYVPRRFWEPEREAEGVLPQDRPPSEWTGPTLGQKRALVFISAAGIAVRTTVPYVRNKMTDPPVVAADGAGHSCVPLLSGHVGGANELAKRATGWLNGTPAITTITDVNGVFVADIFAAWNGLCIADRKEAKGISARLLDDGETGFFRDSEHREAEGAKDIYRHNICMNRVCRHNIRVMFRDGKRPSFLRLVPKMVVMDVGCRKGTPSGVLERRVLEAPEDSSIDPAAVKALSTIDIKAGRAAVPQLAGRYGREPHTFTAEELLAVKGESEEPESVRTAVGVGNACERPCTAGGGIPLIHKRAGEGVTVAAAIEPVAGAGHSQ